MTEKIARLADRSDHVVIPRCSGAFAHRQNVVPGFVQGRTHQVVHGCVNDGKVLRLAFLEEFNAGKQQASIADQSTTGFQHDLQAASGQFVEQRVQITGDGRLNLIIAILDSQAATQIDVVNRDAFCGQLVNEGQNAFQRLGKGGGIKQLRADVAINADDTDVRQGGCAAIQGQRVVVSHAKLRFLETGRNVGVGFRVDVGINAQADRRILAALPGNVVQAFEFRNRFDIEAENASIQRLLHFRSGLADTGKNDFLRVSPGGQHALQFATGNDVETGAQSGE